MTLTQTSRSFMGTIGPSPAKLRILVSSILSMMTRKDYLKLVLCTRTTTVYGDWTGCGYPYQLERYRVTNMGLHKTLYSWYSVPTNSTTSTFMSGYRNRPTCCSTLTVPTTEETRVALGCNFGNTTACPITGAHQSLPGRPHRTSTTSPTNIVGSLPTTTDTPAGCGYTFLIDYRNAQSLRYVYMGTKLENNYNGNFRDCGSSLDALGNNLYKIAGCRSGSSASCPILQRHCSYPGRPYTIQTTVSSNTTGSLRNRV